MSWLVTVYVVGATASTPLWCKLGDRHGRKRLLQVALVWFVCASALCGAAQDVTQLVVVRGAQGVAAGGLMRWRWPRWATSSRRASGAAGRARSPRPSPRRPSSGRCSAA
ncbi:MAG: MFS transporter [Solirubrobacteraceae bacterium]